MRISRRRFLQISGLAAGASMLPMPLRWLGTGRAYAFAQSPKMRKFVTTLPGLSPAGANNIGQYITLPTNSPQMFAGQMTNVYNLGVKMFGEKIHPDLKKSTHFYGYYDLASGDQKYLGGAIVATRGKPTMLKVTNQLPSKHILPVDPTVMAGPNGLMVGNLPQNRTATHLHGGLTPWISDGTPFQWFDPFGKTGISFMNVPGTNPLPGTATYYYPNNQSARLVWYHDHAIGLTRLNAYAGIAAPYIITDDFEGYLLNHGLLPDLVGVPLVIQDKSFVPANILQQDSTWQWGGESDLWYPHVYEANVLSPYPPGTPNPKGRWDYGATVSPPSTGLAGLLPKVSCVPEFFADTALVNGTPYPVLHVTDKTFRFRLLNGSQARFWHLNLYAEGTSGEADKTKPGPTMYQIGTEGGFLPGVAVHDNTTPIPLDLFNDPSGNTAIPDGPFNLLLAPAERADLLIDFTGLAGKSFILYNDAPAPFPGGDSRNDYFTGDPDQTAIGGAPTTLQGYGPNTRTIMKIVVDKGTPGMSITPGILLSLNNALANNFAGGNPGVAPQQDALLNPAGVPVYIKTLNEDFDDYGRLLQRGGTDAVSYNNQGQPTYGQGYLDSITEQVSAGETQIWDFYNTTGDTHPWHFHLVNVQVIGRGPYSSIGGGPIGGNFNPPDANELGWKETVRMNPGEVTRVIMKFDLPVVPFALPTSPRTGGHEYVHHCHILEHEEHDMMRALVVTP